MPAVACGDKAFPVRDGEIDRRQRACREDRAGDDDAGRGFLIDDEIGSVAELCLLQDHQH
jgi:hypothetical protein